MTQDQALAILKTGANVFVTGEPGAGKTHLVNQYVSYLRERGIEPAITASTGIAATHIGGMTIHSWSGIGIKTALSRYELDKIVSGQHIAKRIGRAKVLIIDEVSMLSPDTLALVETVCRGVKRTSEPFGGMQVVFVGDFFQLPPVVRMEQAGTTAQSALIKTARPRFAYDGAVWARTKPLVSYLTEQYRQEDASFLAALAAIRQGVFSGAHEQLFSERKILVSAVPENIPKLFSRNANVDRINEEMLLRLPGEARTYEMESSGRESFVLALKKGCLSPEALSLKIGAAVMFTKNNPREGFVNGTLGTVAHFSKESGLPFVETREGRTIEVSPMDWKIEEGGSARASISQLPLRLAWAITIHKSQGMSLDAAVMDLSDVFEYGQGYVALSRVRALSGLHLLGLNRRAFEVHPDILKRDGAFRNASEEAENAFAALQKEELAMMHDNFVLACGGKKPKAAESKAEQKFSKEQPASVKTKMTNEERYAKLREKHPNAYRPWEASQDEKLKELFEKGTSVKELMESFGRQRGAINARLVKLGLMEQ